MVSWIIKYITNRVLAAELKVQARRAMLKPFKPCKHVGCVELTRDVYCDKHKPTDTRRDSVAWRYLYNTKRWKNMRAERLLISPFCVECERQGRRVRATDVDHINDHKGNRRLFYDVSNLQTLCHSCHSKKTMRENPHPPPKKV